MFQKYFKRTENDYFVIGRILLTDENQLEEILIASKIKPVLLFKHSTSCGISAMVLRKFENKLSDEMDAYHFYFLDLLKYRSISNLIASKFDIPHQSPQLILIKEGEVVHYSSHYGVLQMDL